MTQAQLSPEDYDRILSVLPELYLLQDLSALPKTMIRIVSGLVPNLFCSYNEIHHDPQNVVVVCQPEIWRDRMAPYMPEANKYLHEHPLYRDLHLTTDTAPRSLSDFMPESDWKKTGFARAISEPIGMGDTLMFRLNTNNTEMIFMCVNRVEWGFTTRERQIVDLLRSHFSAARENATAFTNAQALALFSRPDAALATAGVVTIDESGQILHINRPAAELIRKYFEPGSWARTLPPAVQSWVSRDASAGLPVSSLEEANGEHRLSIRWSQLDNGSKILLLEERTARPDAALAGLSRREAEVLHWIAEGKTNLEIGRILSISVRTVEKHVEIVYRKLGVENRMGAILRVLSSGPPRQA